MRLTSNTLRTKVSLYHKVSTLTASTGSTFVGAGTEYPTAYATNVRASVQPQQPPGGIHSDYLPGTVDYKVLLGSAPGLNPTDLIVFTDDDGTTKYLVVAVVRNLAGRGWAWEAQCYQRLS